MNRPNVRRIQELVTHIDRECDFYEGSITPPVFETSIFRAENFDQVLAGEQKYCYSRSRNPTVEVLERLLAKMENGERCKLFSAGTGAILTAMLYPLSKDTHVILEKAAYGRSTNFAFQEFKRFGVEATQVDAKDIENIKAAIRPNTKLIYLESPSSWQFELQDLRAIAKLAKEHGIITVIDNTWATPVFQNPLDFGIDIVIHSASKYLGGHSDLMAGVLVTSQKIYEGLSEVGATLSPYVAAKLLRSLRTLPLRMVQHEKNAMEVAQYLEKHPKVKSVAYPGLPSFPQYELGKSQLYGYSGVMSFILDTDRSGVIRFMNALRDFNITASWGGYECVISASDADPNIDKGNLFGEKPRQIRFSVGLEPVDIVLQEMEDALKAI